MIGQLTYLGSFNGSVAAGSKISFDLPCKGRYNALYIKGTISGGGPATDANLAAALGDVECNIAGYTAVKINATVMKQVAQSMNVPAIVNDGLIPIPFYNPNYDIFAERYNFTWALSKVSSATVYLNIVSATTVLRYDLYADWTGDDTDDLGAFQCYRNQTILAGASSFDNMTLDTYGATAILQGHYLYLVGGNAPTISGVYFDADATTIMNNGDPAVSLASAKASKYTTPATGTAPDFVQIWDGANKPTSGLIMRGISRLRLRATLAGTAVATSISLNTRYVMGAVIK